MGFQKQIEEICERAIETGEDQIVVPPRAPARYTQRMIDERFFQLYHLVKRCGCTMEKINLTDYKIFKSTEEYIPPNKKLDH